MNRRSGLIGVGLCSVVLACDFTSIERDFGPLAVTDEPVEQVAAASGGDGHLVVNAQCVILETELHRRTTLVFREAQIEWDPAKAEATFQDPFVGPIVLKDGLSLGVGGEPIGPSNRADPRASRQWIATPNPGCPPELFEVHFIDLTP